MVLTMGLKKYAVRAFFIRYEFYHIFMKCDLYICCIIATNSGEDLIIHIYLLLNICADEKVAYMLQKILSYNHIIIFILLLYDKAQNQCPACSAQSNTG